MADKVVNISSKVKEGSFLSLGNDQIVIGKKLAKDLGVKLKDRVRILSPEGISRRLPGIDGMDAKMSKSLNNGIYLADSADVVKQKVMQMYTDPGHIRVEDPGKVDGNVVFVYLDVFAKDTQKVSELKEHYKRGGLGDVAVKQYLIEVLEEVLEPIRTKRQELEKDPEAVYAILETGTKRAEQVAAQTLSEVKDAMKINYFKEGKI